MRAPFFALTVATSLIFITLAGCTKGVAGGTSKIPQPVPVVTALVTERSVPLVLNVAGTVESTGSVALQSRVDGQITQVYVHDGDEVKAGQRLLLIDPASYELQKRMAQAALDRDIAKLDNARAKSMRGETLFADHYISKDEHTQLQTDLEGAAATVAEDQAAFDNASLQLSYTTITAPVAGKLGHIALQVGNTVHATAQTLLITLNVLDTVDVSFAIPEQELWQVRNVAAANNIPVQASVSAGTNADDESSATAEGNLTFIDNAADPATGTIKLRARFDNKKRVLWPGQLANITLALPAQETSVVVPSSSVSEGPQGTYVYIVANDAAEQRAVKVHRVAGEFSVATGVRVGERIVIDGQSRLTPNAHVIEQTRQAALSQS
jgi:multidrug efflux system membrane fusion protein